VGVTSPSAEASTRGGVRGWVGWLVRRPTVFGGLAVGLVFFWVSLTPSLLPRPWVVQGVVSGLTAAIGYGVGSGLSALVRAVLRREPGPAVKLWAWRVLVAVGLVGTALVMWWSKGWQNELRRLVELEEESAFSFVGLLVIALVTASIVLLMARLVRSLARFLIRQIDRVAPRLVSVTVGVALVFFIVIGLFQGFLWRGAISFMNGIAGTTNGTTSDEAVRPTTALRSGGPGSGVPWDSLGRMGRDFVGQGPTVADLEKFHGPDCCQQPIRVYVGLDSAPTADARAELAVRELDRTGAFDRAVLGVFNATGTGWINPRVSDSLEYLYRGNTAEVSAQYSFLPSWLSFLVDQTVAAETGRAFVGAVLRRVDQLPAGHRPKVVLYGESLGSFATEKSFDSMAQLRARTDGALLVGPTFSNPLWKDLVAHREPGSPQWLPKVREPGVRFARTPSDLEGFAASTSGARVVYLQNSSDPITWWSLDLAYRKPDWAGPPPAPDRSPALRWFPLVTFWQIVADLTDSLGVPTGFGHHFGSNVVDGWVAVSTPDGWTAADTARLKAVIGEGD